MEHFWRDQSNCTDMYGVTQVPKIVLIDKNGKIAFIGGPLYRENLEVDIERLINDQELENVP